MILDVGCGGDPRGDVNCDLYTGETFHTSVNILIKPHETKNFVRADAHFLPFRDNSFTLVHASHLLEHLFEPVNALYELKRIAKKVVYLRIPKYRAKIHAREGHIYAWDESTFKNFLELAFNNIVVYPRINSRIPELAHGRILNKIYPLKRVLEWIMRQLEAMEIIAICYKSERIK